MGEHRILVIEQPVLIAGFAQARFDTYVDRGVGLVQANTLTGNAEGGRFAYGMTLGRKSCNGTYSAVHDDRLSSFRKTMEKMTPLPGSRTDSAKSSNTYEFWDTKFRDSEVQSSSGYRHGSAFWDRDVRQLYQWLLSH